MWSRGDTVVVRNVWHGRVRLATPWIVVGNDDDRIALWVPSGTSERVAEPRGLPIDWTLREAVVPTHNVVVHRRGEWHSSRFWRDRDGAPRWYVNVEEPWRETGLGFDTRDLFLDVIVEPDRSWRVDDEDELEEAERLGLVGANEVARIRAEAELAIGRVERWESPFSDGWDAWQPDPAWPVPELRAGWDEV